MKRFPWLHQRKKTDPELPYEPPIPIGKPFSNGEFFKEPTAHELKLRKLILDKCDEGARRLGIDRRDFVVSAMGMATTMAVINACGDGEKADGGGGSGGAGGMPPEAVCDEGLAHELTGGGGDEFIVDLQTHHIEDEEHWRESHPGTDWPGAGLGLILDFLSSPRSGANIGNAAYLQKVMVDSEVTVAVLSGFPGVISEDNTYSGHPISNEALAMSAAEINAFAGGSQRVVQHCQVAPNDQFDRQAIYMERIREEHGNHGWKCYPPWAPPGGQGWWLDDTLNTRDGREVVADRFFQKITDLTPSAPKGGQASGYPTKPLLCIHKGPVLGSFEVETNRPIDVGAAATKWPDVQFVIYHSGMHEGGMDRGAFNDANPQGIDELCRQVRDNGLKGKNVYAELGSLWFSVMNNATNRQHVLGKLLKYLGEDNVLFGSECTWMGSPQGQIEILRSPMTEITEQFQTDYAYPALTPDVKRKILGLNAAKLYNLDPEAVRCKVQADELTKLKRNIDGEFGGRRWALQPMDGPRTRREFMRLQAWKRFKNQPG